MTSNTMLAKKFSTKQIFLGIAVIVLLIMLPLFLVENTEFGGSDGAGSIAVKEIAPGYDTEWAANWWSPPGSETESMLFALQATVGGILIGYCFGFLRGRKRGWAESRDDELKFDVGHNERP